MDRCRLPPLGGPVLGGTDQFGTDPSAFIPTLRTVLGRSVNRVLASHLLADAEARFLVSDSFP